MIRIVLKFTLKKDLYVLIGTLSWDSWVSEISGSLNNLKPEKIGLWAKFNRHIQVLMPKFGGAQ